MGDFNHNTIDWETEYSEDETEMKFLDNLHDLGLVQHVDQPTRFRGRGMSPEY